MTKQLKFTSLLLLLTSLTFAQKPQSIANTSKSTIKDSLITDSSKIKTPPIKGNNYTVDQIRGIVDRNKIRDRVVALDSTKTSGTTTIMANVGVAISTQPPKTTIGEAKEESNPTIPNVGIVVKRNNCCPTNCKCKCNHGGASRVGNTNNNGTIIISVTESGDLTFTLSNPSTSSSNGNTISINNGLKVALINNVTGSKLYSNCDNNGNVTFTSVLPGDYTLKILNAVTSQSTIIKQN